MNVRPLFSLLVLVATGTSLAATADARPPATAEPAPVSRPATAPSSKELPPPPRPGPTADAVTPPARAAAETGAPGKVNVPPPLSPRMRQIRERIDVLFAHRNGTISPVSARLDPFRPPGSAIDLPPPASVDDMATVLPDAGEQATGDLATLQKAVATLKVSGTFEIGGRQHLVVNSRPYTDGDVIPTVLDGKTVYLRVREVSGKALTLTLNGAEIALKF